MSKHYETPDVVLVGAGIMSATLAAVLKELDPALTIEIFEGLGSLARESSNAWNNAGTGHAALCELNYTPQAKDGSINVSKALAINEAFEVSKQFWTHLIERGVIATPGDFLTQVPHMSFVRGGADVEYLRKRHEALAGHHLFSGMRFSESPQEIAEWIPLVMEGRDPAEKIAATRVELGTDVNFGALTRLLVRHYQSQGMNVRLRSRVLDLRRERNGRWRVEVETRGKKHSVSARFVFLGAGGGALPLLQKSGIPEGKGFGGFPVSGQWLRCDRPELVDRHYAKVYGKASVGAPPMSVPHLDTRVIGGRRSLLFGPYAGFSTKFLKGGSFLDLLLSVKPDNLIPMLAAGRDNIDLTKYLVGQVVQKPEDRFAALQEYMPNAEMKDWRLQIAGQRVQIIKKDKKQGGVLQFGTEMVTSADGSISALLGASPGASTAVSIMLELVGKCFPKEVKSAAWRERLQQMVPSYGLSLAQDAGRCAEVRTRTNAALGLKG